MQRKGRGIALLAVGIVLLLSAAGWFGYNLWEDKNAGQKAEEILNKIEVAEPQNSCISVDGEAFCGRVIIDALNVELPVYDEWNYTRLKSAPCRYSGRIETDDIIIAAHNYKNHFRDLNKLKIDDQIKFIDAYGSEHIYKVCSLAYLDGTAVSDMQSGDWDFTLFTCTKSGKQRVTVRCERK